MTVSELPEQQIAPVLIRPLTLGERAQMAVNGWTCARCGERATRRVVGGGNFRLCDLHAETTRRNLEEADG